MFNNHPLGPTVTAVSQRATARDPQRPPKTPKITRARSPSRGPPWRGAAHSQPHTMARPSESPAVLAAPTAPSLASSSEPPSPKMRAYCMTVRRMVCVLESKTGS